MAILHKTVRKGSVITVKTLEHVNVSCPVYENEKYNRIKIIINTHEVNYKRLAFGSITKIVRFGKMDFFNKKKFKIIATLLF